MNFTIDPEILDQYRRRGANAHAASRAAYDETRAVRQDLSDLSLREARLLETRGELHPDDAARRQKLEADLRRSRRDEAEAEAHTAYAAGIFGRLSVFAKETAR